MYLFRHRSLNSNAILAFSRNYPYNFSHFLSTQRKVKKKSIAKLVLLTLPILKCFWPGLCRFKRHSQVSQPSGQTVLCIWLNFIYRGVSNRFPWLFSHVGEEQLATSPWRSSEPVDRSRSSYCMTAGALVLSVKSRI